MESGKRANTASPKSGLKSQPGEAACLATAFSRQAFLMKGDSGSPLGRILYFCSVLIWVLYVFTLFYDLFAFHHGENKSPLCSVEWEFLYKICLRAASTPGPGPGPGPLWLNLQAQVVSAQVGGAPVRLEAHL